MKNKKLVISLVVSATMLINTIGVYADAQSIEEAWNQLSSTQQSKLEEVGISTELFNKIDSKLEDIDLGSFGYTPLTYEDNHFTVSDTDAQAILSILGLVSGSNGDKDNAIGVLNDVIEDINSSSSTKVKQDFAKLLQGYGLCSIEELEYQLSQGGGGPAGSIVAPTSETIQAKLEERLANLKQLQVDQYDKAQVAVLQRSHQGTLEILSSYMVEPLKSLDSNSVQKAWQQSSAWIQNNTGGIVFDKASAPVARWDLKEDKEVMIPKEIWEGSPSYARIELEAGPVVMLVDQNTYSSGGSKIKVESAEKEGYTAAVTISSTAKMNYPSKVIFYLEDENPQDYGVYRLDGEEAVLVGGIYNPVRGGVEASIKSSGTYALKKAPAKTYSDLEGATWAKNEIEHLGQKGYIDGKAEGLYAPLDEITRAEFAVLMARILQLPEGNTLNNFEDIKSDAWYYNDIMATVEAKLFSGKNPSSFDPNGKVTRQEVAVVLSRVLVQKGYNEPEIEVSEKGIWAPGALALMKDQYLTTQVPNFNDNVGENANRAEVAYILYNLLQR